MEDHVTYTGEVVSTTVSKQNVSYHFLTHAEHSEPTTLQVFNLTFAYLNTYIFCVLIYSVRICHIFIVHLMYLHF